jgi:hypothetical protein
LPVAGSHAPAAIADGNIETIRGEAGGKSGGEEKRDEGTEVHGEWRRRTSSEAKRTAFVDGDAMGFRAV